MHWEILWEVKSIVEQEYLIPRVGRERMFSSEKICSGGWGNDRRPRCVVFGISVVCRRRSCTPQTYPLWVFNCLLSSTQGRSPSTTCWTKSLSQANEGYTHPQRPGSPPETTFPSALHLVRVDLQLLFTLKTIIFHSSSRIYLHRSWTRLVAAKTARASSVMTTANGSAPQGIANAHEHNDDRCPLLLASTSSCKTSCRLLSGHSWFLRLEWLPGVINGEFGVIHRFDHYFLIHVESNGNLGNKWCTHCRGSESFMCRKTYLSSLSLLKTALPASSTRKKSRFGWKSGEELAASEGRNDRRSTVKSHMRLGNAAITCILMIVCRWFICFWSTDDGNTCHTSDQFLGFAWKSRETRGTVDGKGVSECALEWIEDLTNHGTIIFMVHWNSFSPVR